MPSQVDTKLASIFFRHQMSRFYPFCPKGTMSHLSEFVLQIQIKGSPLDLNLHLLLIKKPFSPCRPPLAAPFLSSPRATARICDRSISNPFSRHSGARVNNPPLMRIVHLLCQLPRGSGRKRFLTAARFHISDSGKISLCAPGP